MNTIPNLLCPQLTWSLEENFFVTSLIEKFQLPVWKSCPLLVTQLHLDDGMAEIRHL